MKMHNSWNFKKYCIFLDFFLLLITGNVYGQGEIFQQGWYAEFVEGDLEEAISCYQKIIKDYPDDKTWSARALLRLGICYEKSGREGAENFYKKIIHDFPEEKIVFSLAQKKLKKTQAAKSTNELAKYYVERSGIDPLASFSYDGRFVARTDWTTGNIVVEEIATGRIRVITHTDFNKSPEYGVQPVWSRDGKFLAFSWFRRPAFLELRIASLVDGSIQTVYSDSNLFIYAQDWHPNGKEIICEIYDFRVQPPGRIALFSLKDKKLHQLAPSSADSRGFSFSPDGQFITYDLLTDEGRQIMVYSLADSSIQRISDVNFGNLGFDNPFWNKTGDLILYRSSRLGKFDLWATPVKSGKVSGKSFLVQPDLTQYLLSLKEINPRDFKISSIEDKIKNEPKEFSFEDDFSSASLNPKWSIFSWKKKNVYGYHELGRISLTENPGNVRYYLSPGTEVANHFDYLPHFSSWYWYYPPLEISRAFWGDRWKLETKFTYYLPDGANTRGFSFIIFFISQNNKKAKLEILRRCGFPDVKSLEITFFAPPDQVVENKNCLSPADSVGINKFTYFNKIVRDKSLLTVLQSENGIVYEQKLQTQLPSDYFNCAQLMTLSGNSWFVPAGSYLDWDYVRVRKLE